VQEVQVSGRGNVKDLLWTIKKTMPNLVSIDDPPHREPGDR
jgi:hypothetical protein